MSSRIEVQISDENDQPPFSPRPATRPELSEGNAPGILLLTVNATDADEGRNRALLYRLTPLGGAEDEGGGVQGGPQGGSKGAPGAWGPGGAALTIDPLEGRLVRNDKSAINSWLLECVFQKNFMFIALLTQKICVSIIDINAKQ